jgi:hypothetical protein
MSRYILSANALETRIGKIQDLSVFEFSMWDFIAMPSRMNAMKGATNRLMWFR